MRGGINVDFSNKELGQYLKSIRESLGYSIYDVNKLCNISPSYLSLMENGKRRPSAIILKKLSSIYNTDCNILYQKAGYKELIKTDELGNQIISIPLLGTVKPGCDYLSQENWVGTIDIDRELAKIGELFALKVYDNSMYPALIEDDFVIVRKQDDFETGDMVVALIKNEEAIIRKGRKTTNGIFLQPLNTDYEPLICTYDEIKPANITIIGIVKQLKREF